MVTITIDRIQADYGFDATDAAGHIVRMDTSDEDGGQGYGARPMQTLLMGLGGCSGIDVVSILKKKKVNFDRFRMVVQGEREQGKVPALWEKVHVDFYLDGDVDEEKAKHAITLSIDKYCSVAETLRRAGATITWSLAVNGQ
ncbi:OsmC family protein [Chitinophagaceae bacterium MMS25-I14]